MSVEALSAVLSFDPGNSTSKLVLVGLANHAHRDGTAAWAGVNTLATYASCSARTVQRCLGDLLEKGFIREGDQSVIDPRIPAKYRPVAYEVALTMETVERWAQESSGAASIRAQHSANGSRRGKQAHSDMDADSTDEANYEVAQGRGDNLSPLDQRALGVTSSAPRGDRLTPPGVTPVSPKPSLEPSKNQTTSLRSVVSPPPGEATATSDARKPVASADADGEQEHSFDEFWTVYPRRTGKVAARKAWSKAVKAADAAQIVDGARRFAADPNLPTGEEARFIPHPSTWLNDGRWDDDPLPPRGNGRRVGSNLIVDSSVDLDSDIFGFNQ